jgi:molecular chaperone DnaK
MPMRSRRLTQASHKLAEAVYAKAGHEGSEQAGEAPREEAAGGEKVVEAEFEELKEDKK